MTFSAKRHCKCSPGWGWLTDSVLFCVALLLCCCSRGAELRPLADQSALTCDPINEAFIHLAGRGAAHQQAVCRRRWENLLLWQRHVAGRHDVRNGRTRTVFGRPVDPQAAPHIKTRPGSGFIWPTLPPTCHFSLPTKLCSLANPAPNAQRGLYC